MKIGPLHIDVPVLLAPMAAVTDLPFRTVCEEMGVGLTITEFLSAHALSAVIPTMVTRADLLAVVRAFDRRIRDARVASAVERVGGALRRVERVTVSLDREDFTDPDLEASYLRDELQALLASRFLHDIDLSVRTEWVPS